MLRDSQIDNMRRSGDVIIRVKGGGKGKDREGIGLLDHAGAWALGGCSAVNTCGAYHEDAEGR